MFLDVNTRMNSTISYVIDRAIAVSPMLLLFGVGVFLVKPNLLTFGFASLTIFLYLLKYMHEKVVLYINEFVPLRFSLPAPHPVEEPSEKNEVDRVENVTPVVRSRRRRRGSG